MLYACQAFFKEHPNYLLNDIHITGESCAGNYIPAASERVHQGNKEKKDLHLNLKVQKGSIYLLNT